MFPVDFIPSSPEATAAHCVEDWAKVRQICRAALAGKVIPPVIVDGEQALNGTHRLAAKILLDRQNKGSLIEVISLDEWKESAAAADVAAFEAAAYDEDGLRLEWAIEALQEIDDLNE